MNTECKGKQFESVPLQNSKKNYQQHEFYAKITPLPSNSSPSYHATNCPEAMPL